MLSLATSLVLLLGSAQAAASSSDVDVEAVLRHSAARGRPLAGLHRAIQREAQSLHVERSASSPSEVSVTCSQADSASNSAQQPFVVTKPKYEAHCFSQRISHFDPSVNGTFCQRYWIDASSYKEGGPIYVLDGGETSGANR